MNQHLVMTMAFGVNALIVALNLLPIGRGRFNRFNLLGVGCGLIGAAGSLFSITRP